MPSASWTGIFQADQANSAHEFENVVSESGRSRVIVDFILAIAPNLCLNAWAAVDPALVRYAI